MQNSGCNSSAEICDGNKDSSNVHSFLNEHKCLILCLSHKNMSLLNHYQTNWTSIKLTACMYNRGPVLR